jgi:tetratricopeptide (TPR) repeat protein
MRYSARRGVVRGTALALMLLLLGGVATAQRSSRFKNIELCNGADRTSPDIQIGGCTALIDSGKETPQALVIAYNNRGNAYMTKGEYDRAVQDYDQSIKLNPNYARAFNNRGVAYQKKGEYDRAINDFDQSIKLNPQYANAFANRAQTYLNKGEYERAVLDYDEAGRLKPTLEAVWSGRCWTRAIIGQLQAALSDCNEALRLKPDSATLDSRGLTYLKMGQWDSAIDDYSSALRLDPKLASSLYGRGLAKLKKGDTAGGNADIAAAEAIEANVVEDFARYGVQ